MNAKTKQAVLEQSAKTSVHFSIGASRAASHIPPAMDSNHRHATSRSRVLSNDELRKEWCAIGDDIFGTTVRLLTLTGQRLGETAIQKEWLDGTTLTIPSAFTKNNREHKVPIPHAAIPFIHKLRPFKSGVNAKASSTKDAVCPASRTMIFAGLM